MLALDSGAVLPASGQQFYRETNGSLALKPLVRACEKAVLAPWKQSDTASTATLQSAHSSIRALADSTVAGCAGGWCSSIAAITTMVYRRLDKRTTATFSSALETLAAGYGDCGEHAVLCAALLRARGIPAHVILGMVYVAERTAYLGHAWVGVQTTQGWLFADPAFGEFPAHGRRVPLLIDNSGRSSMEVLRLVGRVRIWYAKAGETLPRRR